MTKRKLILNTHRKMWEPILQQCIDGLMTEAPRTDNTGPRAKIRVKFPVSFVPPKKLPKCILIEQTEDYIVREWNCVTLLDWMHKLTLSPWSSKDIYEKRRVVLWKMSQIEKSLEV